MTHPAHPRRLVGAAVSLVALLGVGLGGCSDDHSSPPAQSGTTAAAEADTKDGATEAGTEDGDTEADAEEGDTLEVLVTNDDGYDTDGLDTIVEFLAALDGVEVTVVAPLEEQSGQGGRTTEGPLATEEVETASGREATAVDGYPADSVRAALDDLDLEPGLVVSGINAGQNVGPLIDISGTVGAARPAVAAGVRLGA